MRGPPVCPLNESHGLGLQHNTHNPPSIHHLSIRIVVARVPPLRGHSDLSYTKLIESCTLPYPPPIPRITTHLRIFADHHHSCIFVAPLTLIIHHPPRLGERSCRPCAQHTKHSSKLTLVYACLLEQILLPTFPPTALPTDVSSMDFLPTTIKEVELCRDQGFWTSF